MVKPARIFISVAEDSADVHAAALIRKAAELLPDCRFYGLTGPRMRAAGAETVADLAAHAAMLGGMFAVIGRAWKAVQAVEESWQKQPPDLVVLLDSPELNLRLAKRAKRFGLPVLYYIAPQTWASREGRNKQIARDVDRLACILPFEAEYFRQNGVPAEYVGHPLFESLRLQTPNEAVVRHLRGRIGPEVVEEGHADANHRRHGTRPFVIGLLPGSRRHVIAAMLPLQLQVVRQLQQAGVMVKPVVSCVAQDRYEQISECLRSAGFRHCSQSSGTLEGFSQSSGELRSGGAWHAAGSGAEILVGDNASLLAASDLILVASGTATLEVAHYRKPMVVMYDAGPLMGGLYQTFGRRIVKTPHLSLVNILANRRVVPEFMPYIRDLDAVATVARQLLTDESWRRLMVRQIDATIAPLENSQASARICEIIQEMVK